MKKILIFLLAILILGGCARRQPITAADVKGKILDVDYRDGVNREEATVIAQNFLCDERADQYWKLDSPRINNSGDFWGVVFAPKNPFAIDYAHSKPLEIMVVKSNGKIPEQEGLKIK